MKDFFTSVMDTIKKAVDTQFNGNISRASQAWGVTGDNLHKWLRGDRIPTLEKISPILNQLGASLALSNQDIGKDVCFVNAKLVPAGEHVQPPQAKDYIAAPLVGEVGAGPGYVAQDDVKSWFLVYRHHPAIQHRYNLLAVEIAKNSTSMIPLLKPGDLVLVDRNDQDVSRPGPIMLVKDPDDQGMIKRVSVEQQADGDYSVVYYSDNAMENPPICYSLRRHFFNEWGRAIVGRVIWAWADVREK